MSRTRPASSGSSPRRPPSWRRPTGSGRPSTSRRSTAPLPGCPRSRLPGGPSARGTMLTFSAAALLILWLARQVTSRGLGNGVVVLLVTDILGRWYTAAPAQWLDWSGAGDPLYQGLRAALFLLALLVLAVILLTARRPRAPGTRRRRRGRGRSGSGPASADQSRRGPARDGGPGVALRRILSDRRSLPGLRHRPLPARGAGRPPVRGRGLPSARHRRAPGATRVPRLGSRFPRRRCPPSARRAATGHGTRRSRTLRPGTGAMDRRQRDWASTRNGASCAVSTRSSSQPRACTCGSRSAAGGPSPATRLQRCWLPKPGWSSTSPPTSCAAPASDSRIRDDRVIAATGTLALWEASRPRWPSLTVYPHLGGGQALLLVDAAEAEAAEGVLRERGQVG